MKIVKKTLILLLILSLCVLVLPNNKVLAEEDETTNNDVDTQLGSAESSKFLSIVYGVNEETKENKIIKYTITGTESAYTLNVDPVGASIENLSVSIDESEIGGFVVTLTGDVSLSGFYDDAEDVKSLISTNTNLAIVGNGTLNMTIVSNPNPYPVSFEAGDLVIHNCFIGVNGTLRTAANEGSRLTINLDTNVNPNIDERPYNMFVDGITAKNYMIQNTTINSNIRNSLFYCTYDPTEEEEAQDVPVGPVFTLEGHVMYKNLLVLNNSKVVSRYKPLLGDEEESLNIKYRLYHLFYCKNEHAEGEFLVKNSTIDFAFDDSTYYGIRSQESFAIELLDDSSIILDNSTLLFNSNSHVALCKSASVAIENGSYVDCKYNDTRIEQEKFTGSNDNKTMMLVNELYIVNSNFSFESSHEVATPFYIETEEEGGLDTGGRLGKDHIVRFGIFIVENSKDYKGSIKTNNTSADVCVFGVMSGSAFTAPATLTPYEEVLIATNGSSIKTRTSTGELVKNPDVFIADSELYAGRYDGMNAFRYNRVVVEPEIPDPIEKIQWKELVIINERGHSPRHEVLNTGIN